MIWRVMTVQKLSVALFPDFANLNNPYVQSAEDRRVCGSRCTVCTELHALDSTAAFSAAKFHS